MLLLVDGLQDAVAARADGAGEAASPALAELVELAAALGVDDKPPPRPPPKPRKVKGPRAATGPTPW